MPEVAAAGLDAEAALTRAGFGAAGFAATGFGAEGSEAAGPSAAGSIAAGFGAAALAATGFAATGFGDGLSAGAADFVSRFVAGLAAFGAAFFTPGRAVALVLAAGFVFEVVFGSALRPGVVGLAAAFVAFFAAGSAFPPFPARVSALLDFDFDFFAMARVNNRFGTTVKYVDGRDRPGHEHRRST